MEKKTLVSHTSPLVLLIYSFTHAFVVTNCLVIPCSYIVPFFFLTALIFNSFSSFFVCTGCRWIGFSLIPYIFHVNIVTIDYFQREWYPWMKVIGFCASLADGHLQPEVIFCPEYDNENWISFISAVWQFVYYRVHPLYSWYFGAHHQRLSS